MSQGIALDRTRADEVVERIQTVLSDFNLKCGRDWEVAGSYRRLCKTVNDLDVVVAAESNLLVVSALSLAGLEPIRLKKDASIVGFVWQLDDCRFRIELYRALPGKFFEMLLFATGSAIFNVRQRAHAKKLGMKLSQHGLFSNGGLVECDSEEAIFEELKMSYVLPEQRTAR